MDIKKLYKQADEVYHAINYWIGEGEMAVSDHLFPEHDGVRDEEFAAELMMLRQSLYSLAKVCNSGIEHIGRELGDYGITSMQELADFINRDGYNQILVNSIIAANGWDDLCGSNDYDICTNGVIKVSLNQNTGKAEVV